MSLTSRLATSGIADLIQKTTSKNPRSTVGTITEIYDYLRLLYARVGIQHCHKCGKKISQMSSSDIINQILSLPNDSKITILAPIVKEKKGTFNDTLEGLRQKGFVRVMIDGVMTRLDESVELAKHKKHTIKIVLDRVTINDENKSRVASAIERGLQESFGEIEVLEGEKLTHYSEHFACFDCKISFEILEPLSFSFNSPKGACPSCNGLGMNYRIDYKKIINDALPLNKGGIKVIFGFNKSYYTELFYAFCKAEKIEPSESFENLSSQKQNLILYGSPKEIHFDWGKSKIKSSWDGILKIAYNMCKNDSDLSGYMSEKVCDLCNGKRLKLESLSVKVAGLGIGEIVDMPIEEFLPPF